MQTHLRAAALTFTSLVVSLLLAPAPLRAQAPRIERIDIFDAGIYCAETIGQVPQPGAPGGYVNLISEPKLIRRTSEIPMQIGTRFGVRYVIVGTPAGASIDLRLVARFPSPGLNDPATSTMMLVSDYPIPARIGATGFRGNHLEFDWELLPGAWIFEFWDKDRKLAEERFALVRPEKNERRNSGSCAPLQSGIVPKTRHGKFAAAMLAYSAISRRAEISQRASRQED